MHIISYKDLKLAVKDAMAVIRQFEDIEAWRKARELTRMIYTCSKSGQLNKDVPLRDQLRRACISVMSNIAEGFGRGGNKEFAHFLYTARGSVAEVQAQLYIAMDAGHITKDQSKQIYSQATDTSSLITGFISYLKSSDLKGPRHKP